MKNLIITLLSFYHDSFMTLALKFKLFNFYSYHRELYEQVNYAYGRYSFLKKI